MKRGRIAVLAAMALALVAASGCGVDVAKQLATNEQMRTQVLDAIVANKDLTGQVLDKLMASDSTRVAVVDKMLSNNEVAKQVIVRVGTSKQAIEMVLGVAVQDSSTRDSTMAMLTGMEMAGRKT